MMPRAASFSTASLAWHRSKMAKTDFTSVDQYLARQPEAVRALLERVRSTIRKAVPDAQETISYQIPAYKLPGGAVLYFAGWKKHYAIYPVTEKVVTAFKSELAPYEMSKGTVRFPLEKPVPVRLIARIAKMRAKEVAEGKSAKAAAKKR